MPEKASSRLRSFLHQGHQVAVEHRGHGENPEKGGDGVAVGSRQRGETNQNRHGADLGQRGDQAGGFIRGALIDIRRPEMEGEDRQLVEEAAESQGQAGDRQRGMEQRLQPGHHFGERSGAGQAVEVAQAEEHDPVRGDAKHEILDGRFHLVALAVALAAHRHQQIEGKGGRFQGHDQGDELDAADEHEQPGDVQRQEELIFRLHVLADVT